jgi:phage replication-related protein YjqB (UPF0714/DUF867 family)
MPEPLHSRNSELYADPKLVEGVDYARRHRRHERFDDSLERTDDLPRTTILAPHGGGIERGTSELCLAVAGYHPANLPQFPPAGVTYDYWMFEGIRESGNAALHVTSTGCDDDVAVSLCAGSLNALSLHGFDPAPEFPADAQKVLVGGANARLKDLLLAGLDEAHFEVVDAAGTGEPTGIGEPTGNREAAGNRELDGDDACNIVNRTMLTRGGVPIGKGGAQLELSSPLRDAMFAENTRPRRKHTTNELFWTFVAVCRDAIDRLEAEQIELPPDLQCRKPDS